MAEKTFEENLATLEQIVAQLQNLMSSRPHSQFSPNSVQLFVGFVVVLDST